MSKRAILVAGCGGRMGRALLREIIRAPGVDLAGGFDRPEHPAIGTDLGALAGLERTGLQAETSFDAALKHAAAVIDFTAPEASLGIARAAADARVALILGTTGFSPDEEREIDLLAKKIPIVRSGNFSLGVNLLAALVEEAARRLSDDYDIEILETHHRDKVDAPSGTALMLGRAAAAGRGVALEARSVRTRDGRTGPRKAGDIGFAVLRGGGVVGEHQVMFAAADELLTLSHTALDRALFAKGAVAAARYAIGRKPGRYSMRDVLGLTGTREQG